MCCYTSLMLYYRHQGPAKQHNKISINTLFAVKAPSASAISPPQARFLQLSMFQHSQSLLWYAGRDGNAKMDE